MIDVTLLYSLVQAIRPDTALLLIGDVDQLPSVGPGQTLRDMLESRALPVVRLTEIFRQAAESEIVRNAHAVNAGDLPNLTTTQDSDFFFVETRDSDDTQARILKIVAERIPARFGLDPMRDVQVLCPMHRGSAGTQSLNAVLKQTLNPTSDSAPKLSRDGVDFTQGDKVMQVINNYDKDVYNGDIGWVGAIDLEGKTADIKYESRVVRYAIDELDQINLAYAITIHKSQGSEYPAVVIPFLTEHFVMLKRNLLYTAMTRGKQLVVLLGQRRAIEIAVRGSDDLRRTTKLADWLRS
jgi:exodeoxyribonuclease V alpha subunit